jgi:hypothetical protein
MCPNFVRALGAATAHSLTSRSTPHGGRSATPGLVRMFLAGLGGDERAATEAFE